MGGGTATGAAAVTVTVAGVGAGAGPRMRAEMLNANWSGPIARPVAVANVKRKT